MKLSKIASAAIVAMAVIGGSAHAALTSFQTFVGTYGVSTDGWGSVTQRGVISANVPAGATVAGAYLYTSTFGSGIAGAGGSIAGSALSGRVNLGQNTDSTTLEAGRFDVTSILKPLIDGGPGGLYNFNVTETSGSQDGYALVVVYSQASLPQTTIGILDGFARTTGETTAINFADPLNTAAPGFSAEMRLGIGFSFNSTGCPETGQTSRVRVNGTTITERAGCNDDSADATASNGNLITMGGDDDAFSAFLPTTANDHERYNLVPQITNGDTSIVVNTINASNDDNIFLAVFKVSGRAGVNEPPPPPVNPNPTPEPASLLLVGVALAGLGVQRRTARRR